MKFKCKFPSKKKKEARGKWHLWFAWHPIELECGQCAVFERVLRKGTYIEPIYEFPGRWTYEYQPAKV